MHACMQFDVFLSDPHVIVRREMEKHFGEIFSSAGVGI